MPTITAISTTETEVSVDVYRVECNGYALGFDADLDDDNDFLVDIDSDSLASCLSDIMEPEEAIASFDRDQILSLFTPAQILEHFAINDIK